MLRSLPLRSRLFLPPRSFRSLHRNRPLRYTHSEGTGNRSIYKTRSDPWLTPTIFIIGFIPVFTFALGTWQLQRLKWKVALIDELEEKLRLEPLSLPGRVNLSALPEFIYRKVRLRGKWDHGHSMLLGPRVYEGKSGFHLVTPLVRTDGSTVLVNRGFISNDFVDRTLRPEHDGEVELVGVLRTSHTRNNFTPDNEPEEGKWYWADIDAMSVHAGGEKADVQPVYVEEVFEGHAGDAATRISKGIPIGRNATVDLRNAHLSYVITWYSLSAVTTAMLVRLLLNRKRTTGRRLPR